jgi:hypothetical protein
MGRPFLLFRNGISISAWQTERAEENQQIGSSDNAVQIQVSQTCWRVITSAVVIDCICVIARSVWIRATACV